MGAKMRACAGVMLGVVLLFATSASAEDGGACADAETTVQMRACLDKVYERADAELNAVWKSVMAAVAAADDLSAKDRKAWKDELLQAQRGWIAFKEHDCDAVGFEWWGASGAPGAILSCLIAHTTARTTNLKDRYFGG